MSEQVEPDLQPDLHVVAEEEDPRDYVDFMGRRFHLADQVGLMPILRFAHAAHSGLDSADEEGMAAMYDLLHQIITDEEWPEFEHHATTTRADDDDLLEMIQQAMTVLGERPTKRSSDSSAGPQITSGKSADVSSSRAIARLESSGRPDLALIVTEAVEHRAAAS